MNPGNFEVDAALSALYRVSTTLRSVEGRIGQVLDAIDSHTRQRQEGKDWRVVVCEDAPPLVDLLNGVAAVVNQEVITFGQVRELTGPKERESLATLRGTELVEKIKEVRTAAINDLIDRALIVQDFKAKAYSIP